MEQFGGWLIIFFVVLFFVGLFLLLRWQHKRRKQQMQEEKDKNADRGLLLLAFLGGSAVAKYFQFSWIEIIVVVGLIVLTVYVIKKYLKKSSI